MQLNFIVKFLPVGHVLHTSSIYSHWFDYRSTQQCCAEGKNPYYAIFSSLLLRPPKHKGRLPSSSTLDICSYVLRFIEISQMWYVV